MKRLLGYRKKIVSLMCAVMIVSIGVLSTSFDSKASYHEYYLNYAEPVCGESSGYINLLMRNASTGQYVINTYFWSMTPLSNSGESSAYAYITLDRDYLKFNVGSSSGVSVYYHLGVYGSYGDIQEVASTSSSATTKYFSSGWTCAGFKYKGNVGYFSRNPNFDELIPDYKIYFNGDSSAVLLSSILDLIGGMSQDNEVILSRLYSIMNSVDGVENQLASVIDYLKDIEIELDEVNAELDQIFYKAEAILDEQKKSNTWLGKIWDSIQEFINPKNEDSSKTDDFQDSSNAQKNEINELNEENQVEKVDVDSASTQVDSSINYDNMAEYGGVLATVTSNNYVLQMLLIVVAIAVIAYVLFGKR